MRSIMLLIIILTLSTVHYGNAMEMKIINNNTIFCDAPCPLLRFCVPIIRIDQTSPIVPITIHGPGGMSSSGKFLTITHPADYIVTCNIRMLTSNTKVNAKSITRAFRAVKSSGTENLIHVFPMFKPQIDFFPTIEPQLEVKINRYSYPPERSYYTFLFNCTLKIPVNTTQDLLMFKRETDSDFQIMNRDLHEARFQDHNKMIWTMIGHVVYDTRQIDNNDIVCGAFDSFTERIISKPSFTLSIEHVALRGTIYLPKQKQFHIRNCQHFEQLFRKPKNGLYKIFPDDSQSMQVYCDMESDPEVQWIVIQTEMNNSINLGQSEKDYKNGFGDLEGNFWLGNEKIHQLTSVGEMKIRFDFWDEENNFAYAQYDNFSLANETNRYRLKISDHPSNLEVGMKNRDREGFTTLLSDCFKEKDGGQWFFKCPILSLNGQQKTSGDSSCDGGKGYHSIKKSLIKIAYRNFL